MTKYELLKQELKQVETIRCLPIEMRKSVIEWYVKEIESINKQKRNNEIFHSIYFEEMGETE